MNPAAQRSPDLKRAASDLGKLEVVSDHGGGGPSMAETGGPGLGEAGSQPDQPFHRGDRIGSGEVTRYTIVFLPAWPLCQAAKCLETGPSCVCRVAFCFHLQHRGFDTTQCLVIFVLKREYEPSTWTTKVGDEGDALSCWRGAVCLLAKSVFSSSPHSLPPSSFPFHADCEAAPCCALHLLTAEGTQGHIRWHQLQGPLIAEGV